MKRRRTKKPTPSYLRLVSGEKLSPGRQAALTKKAQKLAKDKDVTVIAVNRPFIALVQPHEISPEKGLSAKTYLDAAEARDAHGGRSRNYPEINVLNSAKAWYRGILRLARAEGYTDMKKFFKETALVSDFDKRLFDAVGAFIEFENKEARR